MQLFHWLFSLPSDTTFLKAISSLTNRASCKGHLSPVYSGVLTEVTLGDSHP